ncbi:MAG: glutamate-1-semialdehyde 2,1-aminomutase [Deltaproteobacteria bacterium]|nr:glutamate-1-semialdehyde 2,1-aminomutase [Deltaproteobacteria bacterium]
MKLDESSRWMQRAGQCIPGGVNSPVRAGKAVGVQPRFIASGRGARLTDVDGNRYLDYVGSWGPLILGHRPPEVVEAVEAALARGTSFGAPTALEVELAELVCELYPSMEMVRMVNSGTEAAMSAVRLARAATGRDMIVKFDGCYHGHADSLLVAAGSGVATLGIPGSPGIPEATASMTLSLPYNDLGPVTRALESKGGEVACVIVEPVAGNMGVVAPDREFLAGLRALCDQHGCLLIFDEVMCGFRVALGGAQERYGVTPDLTCLGKIIGGGMPVGAYGGRRDLMEQVAPSGTMYQAGTLSGNPMAMAAGLATLRVLRNPEAGVYGALERLSAKLAAGLASAAEKAGVPVCVNRAGSMLTLFFTQGPVRDFETAKQSDTDRFAAFYRAMLDFGVYLPASQFEAWFVSLAHTQEDVDYTIEAAGRALKALQAVPVRRGAQTPSG